MYLLFDKKIFVENNIKKNFPKFFFKNEKTNLLKIFAHQHTLKEIFSFVFINSLKTRKLNIE